MYNIYLINYQGTPIFLQHATDYKHANQCCDIYFDDLWTYGFITHKGVKYYSEGVKDIYMVLADKDPYKEAIQL